MGRRGLVGTVATTAVVAGTATAVSGHMRGKQAEKAQEAGRGTSTPSAGSRRCRRR
jgi:hypothetical protein